MPLKYDNGRHTEFLQWVFEWGNFIELFATGKILIFLLAFSIHILYKITLKYRL